MTHHDQELRQYNHITHKLDQIDAILTHLSSLATFKHKDRIYQDSICLAHVYLTDVIHNFRKYSEIANDQNS